MPDDSSHVSPVQRFTAASLALLDYRLKLVEQRAAQHHQTLFEGNGDDSYVQRLDILERAIQQFESRRERISQRLWTLGLGILAAISVATLVLLWRLSFVMQTLQQIKPPL